MSRIVECESMPFGVDMIDLEETWKRRNVTCSACNREKECVVITHYLENEQIDNGWVCAACSNSSK